MTTSLYTSCSTSRMRRARVTLGPHESKHQLKCKARCPVSYPRVAILCDGVDPFVYIKSWHRSP